MHAATATSGSNGGLREEGIRPTRLQAAMALSSSSRHAVRLGPGLSGTVREKHTASTDYS